MKKILLFILLLIFTGSFVAISAEKNQSAESPPVKITFMEYSIQPEKLTRFTEAQKERIEAALASGEGALFFLHPNSNGQRNGMTEFHNKIKNDHKVKDIVHVAYDEVHITFQEEFVKEYRKVVPKRESALMYSLSLISIRICEEFRETFLLPDATVYVWGEKIGDGPLLPSTCDGINTKIYPPVTKD